MSECVFECVYSGKPRQLHSPLLQQILGHLYLLGRPRYRDNSIGRTGQRLIDGDEGIRFHANLSDALAGLADDRTGELMKEMYMFKILMITRQPKIISIQIGFQF